MPWTTPQFTKGQVDRAGARLADPEPYAGLQTYEEIMEATNAVEHSLAVINNWRSSHRYPLHIIKKTLHYRARKIDETALIAQRLKRLSSIAIKLRRNPRMKLSQMQDIGGCRAVMRDVFTVSRLADVYDESLAKNPNDRPERIEVYDYIMEPKPDGYRGVHYVYKYRSKAEQHKVFNGLRVEVQMRSLLQHYWATAVETVSTFTGQALKLNIGRKPWKRFFALMGSALARREDCPAVPGTPESEAELVAELRELYRQLNVEMVLRGWSEAIKIVTGPELENAVTFLLVLDAKQRTIQVTGFRKAEVSQADNEYLRVEKENVNNPDIQAVLVAVDSVAALQSAYPNYYLDTRQFLEAVQLAVTGVVTV